MLLKITQPSWNFSPPAPSWRLIWHPFSSFIFHLSLLHSYSPTLLVFLDHLVSTDLLFVLSFWFISYQGMGSLPSKNYVTASCLLTPPCRMKKANFPSDVWKYISDFQFKGNARKTLIGLMIPWDGRQLMCGQVLTWWEASNEVKWARACFIHDKTTFGKWSLWPMFCKSQYLSTTLLGHH